MTMFDEYSERTEEFVDKHPKEIADEVKSDVKRQESDTNIRESDEKFPEIDASIERRFNYIALELLYKEFQSGAMDKEAYCQAIRRFL